MEEEPIASYGYVTADPTEIKTSRLDAIKALSDGLFRKLLALIIILGGGAFLWNKADPAQVKAYVYGMISVAIGFYFNTSQSSQDKTKQIQDMAKKGGKIS